VAHTSRNLEEFARRFLGSSSVHQKAFLLGATRVARKAALVGLARATALTPVDTGRCRGGWLVGIAVAPTGVPDEERRVATAIADGQAIIAQWNVGESDSSIFIINNVDYAPLLDNGSSAQSPAGMTSAAAKASRTVIKREGARLLDRLGG
jgi:hypothetical protein